MKNQLNFKLLFSDILMDFKSGGEGAHHAGSSIKSSGHLLIFNIGHPGTDIGYAILDIREPASELQLELRDTGAWRLEPEGRCTLNTQHVPSARWRIINIYIYT